MAVAGGAKAEGPENFLIDHLDVSPQDAAAMVREHVETDESWSFIAEFPMMAGAVIGMKICYNDVRSDVVRPTPQCSRKFSV